MASGKRSARIRAREEFVSSLGPLDDAFERARAGQRDLDDRREAALLQKACTSKRRYRTSQEARSAIESCAAHGRRGLSWYCCPHCGGYHLTSHPR